MVRTAVVQTGPVNKLAFLKDSKAQYLSLVRRTYGFPGLVKRIMPIAEIAARQSSLPRDLWYSIPSGILDLINRKETYNDYASRIDSFFIQGVSYRQALRSFEHLPLGRDPASSHQRFFQAWKDLFMSPYEGWSSAYQEMVDYAVEEDPALLGVLRQFQQSALAVRNLIIWAYQFEKTAKAMVAEADRYDAKSSWGASKDHYPPAKDVEVLYHTSTQAAKIASEGFKTRDELGEDKASLGGGPSNLISFTASLQEAKEIASRLRELIQIANGVLTLDDVIKRAAKYRIDLTKDIEYTTYMRYLEKKNSSDPRDQKWAENNNPSWSIEDLAMYLYRSFLAQGPKYDPVFFGVRAKNFKGLRPENVGIIAAEVDMSQVKEYLEAMFEYRVPVSGIRRIVRVIK